MAKEKKDFLLASVRFRSESGRLEKEHGFGTGEVQSGIRTGYLDRETKSPLRDSRMQLTSSGGENSDLYGGAFYPLDKLLTAVIHLNCELFFPVVQNKRHDKEH